jgi:hypothetical protein
MKTKLLIPTLLALTLSFPALSAMAATNTKLLGEAQPASAASRVIKITPDTKYVNVQGGEIINFDIAGKTFAWNFDGADSSIQLNQIAPQGLLDHLVYVDVAPNPLYAE